MAKVRLYADPAATGRVGIPVDGELFDAEDAKRLVGQGIATRTRPGKASKPATVKRSAAKPASPAKEG